LSIGDKLPLLNSSSKLLRIVGYLIYGAIGIFILLIILGLLIGQNHDTKPGDSSNNSIVGAAESGNITEKIVKNILRSHNGGHEYTISMNDMGESEGYNIAIILLPKDEWSSESLVKNSANTFTEILKELYKYPDVGRVYIAQQGEFTDQYGNPKVEKAVVVDMRRSTASKINWDKFPDMVLLDYNDLFSVADSYSIHQAIRKNLAEQ